MKGAALVAPVVVLVLVHLLQRLEVWATDTSPHPTGRRVVSHLDAQAAAPSLRQTPVPQRRREEEASHHG